MKKMLVILLAVLLIANVSGCSSAQTSGSGSPAQGSGKSAEAPADKAENEEDKYDKMDKIMIGCVTSLTGERAQNGVYTSEAMNMWVEEVNASGGILGKQVEVVYEDDQGTDQAAANAYQKLMSRGDICAVMCPAMSSYVLASEPYIAQYKMPTFTAGSSAKMADIGNEYLWQIRFNDFMAGSTMAKAAFSMGVKKPALIHESDSFGQGLADAARNALIELGLKDEDIIDFTYNNGEKNFAPFMAKIKEENCDAILAVSQTIEASLVMMQVKASGLDYLPCIGSTSYGQVIAIDNAKDAAENWYSCSDWSPTLTTSPAKEWIEAYNAKYGHWPDMPSSTTWDSMLMLKEAITIAGSCNPQKINEALGTIKDLQGVASVLTPNSDRICATTQFLTKNIDGKSVIKEVVER